MYRYGFFLAVTVLLLSGTGLARALTLDECVALALRNNPDIRREELGVRLADQAMREQKSRNFGRLDLVSTYTHYNLPRTLAPLTPASLGSDPAGVATTRNLFTGGITYEVALFTGFADTRSVEIAALQKEMAASAFRVSREQLIYNVRSLYVSILSAQEQARAQEAYADALQRLHDKIARELELGKKARIDLLKASADLENARAVQNQIRNNIASLRSALASLLNIDRLGDLVAAGPTPPDLPAATAPAPNRLQHLARLRSARLAAEKEETLARKAESVLYPQVLLTSAYGQNFGPNDQSNIYSGEWNSEQVWQAGLTLRWNIFDFGSSRARIRQAKIAARRSRYQEQATKLSLRNNLQEAVARINTAISDHSAARAELALTRETVAIEQVRFDQGAADINDLLTARARNRLAQSRAIDAGFRYRTARYYLDYLLEQGEQQ